MLCLSIKTYLQGFNLLWYDVLNKVTLLREQVLLQLAAQLAWWILILKIIYWKWPVVVSPIQWPDRESEIPLRYSCRTKRRSQGHISILSLFSLVFFIVSELLTLLFSMFDILISKGFVSSQHWKSIVMLEISTSCILFAVLKIIL